MWTYDGILIEKKEKICKVFSDDPYTLEVFADEKGLMHEELRKESKIDELKDGLYQAEVGYGPINSLQNPGIYWIKRISDVLDWSRDT
jgi:hypothetical protein